MIYNHGFSVTPSREWLLEESSTSTRSNFGGAVGVLGKHAGQAWRQAPGKSGLLSGLKGETEAASGISDPSREPKNLSMPPMGGLTAHVKNNEGALQIMISLRTTGPQIWSKRVIHGSFGSRIPRRLSSRVHRFWLHVLSCIEITRHQIRPPSDD